MARPRKETRIYWRDQGGVRRAYANFLDFADVGGAREALIPEGQTRATESVRVAEQLAAKKLLDYQKKRETKALTGKTEGPALAKFAAHHLVQRAKAGKVRRHELEVNETHLKAAIEFFGPDKELTAIGVKDLSAYLDWLREHRIGFKKNPDDTERKLSNGTLRRYLNALGKMYRRASSEEEVPLGYNPVEAMEDKPVANQVEADYLTVAEAVRVLEAARKYRPKRTDNSLLFMYQLVATYLLTGARETEVYGLELTDVSFDRRTLRIRNNDWRLIKNATSHRDVPLWPQLETVLQSYYTAPFPGRLLFPVVRNHVEQMVTDIRKPLNKIAKIAELGRPLRTRMFRHTYCTMRLQTLDNGAPVSPFTVMREMGHSDLDMINRIYGHLGTIRHRSEVVEYVSTPQQAAG